PFSTSYSHPSRIGHNHRAFPSVSGGNSIMHSSRTPPFVIRHTSILLTSFPEIPLHLGQQLLQGRPAAQVFQSQFGDVPPARPRRLPKRGHMRRSHFPVVHQHTIPQVRLLPFVVHEPDERSQFANAPGPFRPDHVLDVLLRDLRTFVIQDGNDLLDDLAPPPRRHRVPAHP